MFNENKNMNNVLTAIENRVKKRSGKCCMLYMIKNL